MRSVIESGPYRSLQDPYLLIRSEQQRIVLATSFTITVRKPSLLALFVGHDRDGDLLEGRTALAVPGSATPAGSGGVISCGSRGTHFKEFYVSF